MIGLAVVLTISTQACTTASGRLEQELCAGLLALPPLLRTPPGGPLDFELDREATAFGLGDAEHPEVVDGRFRLYAWDDAADRRAQLRLEALTPEERRRLWQRRAAVHAVVRRWDEALGWSASDRWHRATGWLRAFDRPFTFSEQSLHTYAGAFSRARGRDSAALDLATFAEEAFVPADAIHPGAVPVDDRVACQEFSKTRALRSLLLNADLLDSEGVPPLEPVGCPAFEDWLDADALSHAEVLLVASSGRRPESLFGHVLLRFVHAGRERVDGPSFGLAVQLVALNGTDRGGLGYLAKGLAGGFPLVTLTAPIGDVLREAARLEQRSVRRYRLNLSRGELRRLGERVWEAERRGYASYYFLSENCAAALLTLVDGALETARVERPAAPWVLPTAALDALSRAGLLTPLAGAFRSSLDEALQATSDRDEVLASLPAAWARWPEVAEPPVLKAEPALIYRHAAATVRLARAAADLADADRLALLADVFATSAPRVDGNELAVRRQQLFEREDLVRRRLAVIGQEASLLDVLDGPPPRALDPDEQAVVDRARLAKERFRRVADLAAGLVAGLDVNPVEWTRRDEERRADAERARLEGTIPRSGSARFALAPGAFWSTATGTRGLVSVRTAAYAEDLGDQRQIGLQRGGALSLLDAETALSLAPEGSRLERSRVTLVGYRSLVRPAPALRTGVIDAFGWGARGAWEYEAAQPLPHRTRLSAELLGVLVESPAYERFVAAGLGLAGRAAWGASAWSATIAPRALLTARVALGAASGLRLEASVAPHLVLGAWTHLWEWQASLRADLVTSSVVLSPSIVAARDGGIGSLAATFGVEWP